MNTDPWSVLNFTAVINSVSFISWSVCHLKSVPHLGVFTKLYFLRNLQIGPIS